MIRGTFRWKTYSWRSTDYAHKSYEGNVDDRASRVGIIRLGCRTKSDAPPFRKL
jgi:hypothetical protein